MGKVGVRDLKRDASEILRQVREEDESFEVTYHGRVIARLIPVEESEEKSMTIDEIFEAWWELTADDPDLPEGNYAVDTIRESRSRLE